MSSRADDGSVASLVSPPPADVAPDVHEAIEDLRRNFGVDSVNVFSQGGGGAQVLVKGVNFSGLFIPEFVWFGFEIPSTYPYADIYPHFCTGELKLKDGRPFHSNGLSPSSFQGSSALQISLRSRTVNGATTDAVTKLWSVIAWMRKTACQMLKIAP